MAEIAKQFKQRPVITSYDSLHEHSIERLFEVRAMVEDADRDQIKAANPIRAKAKAATA